MLAAAALAALLLSATPQARAEPAPQDGGVPTIPPATLDDTLEVAGEAVLARMADTRVTVPVRIDGQGPFRFLVDSGADRTVVSREVALRLALPPGGIVRLQSLAGERRVETATMADITVGSSVVHGVTAPVLPQRFIGADGVLGIDALADQRLKLDFTAGTVTVQDAGRRERIAANEEEIVVTARRRKGQLILTQASAGRIAIAAVIDSGAEVTVANAVLRARLFRGRRAPVATTISLISVTGDRVPAELIVVRQLTIGGIVLTDVPVAFAEVPPFRLFGLDRQPAVLLGTDVLQSFRRVSLDFRGRRIRFVLPEGVRSPRTGLVVH